MTWRSFFIAGLVGMAVCLLLVIIERAGIEPKFFAEPIEALTHAFLGQAKRTGSGPGFEKIVVVDFDEADWRTQAAADAANRTAPVQAFDRGRLADTLNHLGNLKAPPGLVIVDIEVAPSADPAAEKKLHAALAAWADAPARPPLVLVRTDSCGEPRGGYRQKEIHVWRSTPYDDVIDREAPLGSRIFWACPLIAPGESIDRQYYAYGCADETKGIASPGLLARWILSQPPARRIDKTVATRFKAAYAARLSEACARPPPADPLLRWPSPVVFSFSDRSGAAVGYAHVPMLAFLKSDAKANSDWGGALVVVGQSNLRAGDRHWTDLGESTPGMELLAAHVDTFVRETARPRPSLLLLGAISLTLSLGSVAIFWSFAHLQRMWAARHRRHRTRRLLVHFMLGPSRQSALCAALITLGAARLLGGFVAAPFWRELIYALIGAIVAIEVAGTFMAEGESPAEEDAST